MDNYEIKIKYLIGDYKVNCSIDEESIIWICK